MNKKEQATFDAALSDMYAARAMRWPEYDKPVPMTSEEIKAAILVGGADVKDVKNDYSSSTRRTFIGWTYNEHASGGDGRVDQMGSDGSAFCYIGIGGKPDGSWTRTGHSIYRTQEEAFRALRHDLTIRYAKQLAKIDAQIKAVS